MKLQHCNCSVVLFFIILRFSEVLSVSTTQSETVKDRGSLSVHSPQGLQSGTRS